MTYSTVVSSNTGTKTLLSVVENQLVVELLSASPDSTATIPKELISLENIYSVRYDNDKLSIHAASDIDLAENLNDTDTGNQGLINVRPKDAKWTLSTLTFSSLADTDLAAAHIPLVEFAKRLQEQALPQHAALADTKVTVVLNPTSGSRLAETQWQNVVKPMLIAAGFKELNIDKISTQSGGKTRALAEALGQRILSTASDDKPVPIIISMGGDGTLHEVANGLSDASASGIKGRFRLGVIPAGSGNAFALGLGIESIEHAVLKIIKATQEKPFYFMHVRFGHSQDGEEWHQNISYDADRKPIRLLVVMSWGFHAQIVSKSRYLRYFMGNKRFSLVAMYLLTFLQQYEGELVLNHVRKYDAEKETFDEQPQETLVFSKDSKFTYFVATKQHSLEKGFKITPFASSLTDDMDVVILRDANADALTKASIGAFQGGKHVNSSSVEYFKASELLLRVKNKAELCLDGEIHDLPAAGILQLKVEESSTEQSHFTVFV